LKRILFFTVFVILFFQSAFEHAAAQGFVIDTTAFYSINDSIGPDAFIYEFANDEGIADENNIDEKQDVHYQPADLIFIPSDVANAERWDTLYIRTGKADFSKFDTPRAILLNDPANGSFCFPFKGKLLSPYGPRGRHFHAGLDIKLESGDTVRSAFSGKVRIARVMSGYGKMVVVRHANGLETVYGHLSKILVNINQDVTAGEVIGLGGRTGRATTTHLHFETRITGEHFNPLKIIDCENFCLIRDTLLVDRDLFSRKSIGPSKTSSSQIIASASGASAHYHTIRSGDTLYALALRYNTTVKKICKLNGITENKKLKIGARLRIS